jgi:CheY-like chemotaxis protein
MPEASKRILIIDEDVEFRKMAAEVLQEDDFGPKNGFEIVQLAKLDIGLQAIERDQDFVGVVCAWKNPDATRHYPLFTGLDLFHSLRRHRIEALRTLPVIIHSSDSFTVQRAVTGIPHTKVVSKMRTHTLPRELQALLQELATT